MIKRYLEFLTSDTLWRVWVVLIALGLWHMVSVAGVFSRVFLPSPFDVLHRFIVLGQLGYAGIDLDRHILASLVRLFKAYAVVALIGVPLGLAMGYSLFIKAVFDPIIEFYRPVPPLAYLMLLIVWLGIGEAPKVALLFLVGLPPVVISTATAVRIVRIERIHGARSLGANQWQVFRYIVFPSCLPQILAGLRIAFGLSFSALVAAEMIAASEGIGWVVRHASTFLRTDVVLAGIFIMALVALVAEFLFRRAERKLVPWAGRA